MKKKAKVIIIGTGVAGMTAAMHLLEQGYQVHIYEATGHIGGRCFAFYDEKAHKQVSQALDKELDRHLFVIDNGQHLLSGAYKEFGRLLKWLGTDQFISSKDNFNINFADISTSNTLFYNLNTANIPFGNTLNFLIGLLKMNAITLKDKLAFLKSVLTILSNWDEISSTQASLLDICSKLGFSTDFIKRIWEPICVAMMNVPLENGSVSLMLNIIRTILASGSGGLSLPCLTIPFSELFKTFEQRLAQHAGSQLVTRAPVRSLLLSTNICEGVLVNNIEVRANSTIAAIPPRKLASLMPKLAHYNVIFPPKPILSIYIWIDKPLFDMPYFGIVGSNIDWIFNLNTIKNIHAAVQNVFLYSITISNATKFSVMEHKKILDIVLKELHQVFNIQFKVLAHKIINSKNGTTPITNTNQQHLPNQITHIKNFYIAGDWACQDLPPTIEAAAISGLRAAELIINS